MKFIKISIIFICLTNLIGCNNTITRLWNGEGYKSSPARQKAFGECVDEYQKIDPEPLHEDLATDQSRMRRAKASIWISECTQNKVSKK